MRFRVRFRVRFMVRVRVRVRFRVRCRVTGADPVLILTGAQTENGHQAP